MADSNIRPFPTLPVTPGNNSYDDIRRIVENVMNGKLNNVGSFDVLAGATQTKVPDRNVGNTSFISFIGLSANSSLNGFYVIERNATEHFFVVGHEAADNLRSYSYAVFG